MSAAQFTAWLAGEREQLRWIEFDEYARSVFGGNPSDWYTASVAYINAITQAYGLIKPQVLSIDVTSAAISAAGGEHADLAVLFDLRKDYLHEVIDALAHRYADTTDLFVKIDSPRDLLLASGRDAEYADDFDNLDDASLVICNVLRSLADKPICGLLLCSSQVEGLSQDEIEAYEPILSIAKHYQWHTVLAYTQWQNGALPPSECDAIVLPNVDSASLIASGASGGGLSSEFWSGANADFKSARLIQYGTIPASAEPETVIAQLSGLPD